MSIPPTNFSIFSKHVTDVDTLRKQWGWFLLLGILLIILGLISITAATVVTEISVILFGALLLGGGIVQIAYAFWMHQWGGFFLSLLAGILYTITGFLLLAHPTAGALSLTLLLAAFYMVGGIFRLVSAAMMHFEHWGWAFFSGLIKLCLGLLILLGWPATGLWVFGLFIGIDLLFFGWFWVLIALTARQHSI